MSNFYNLNNNLPDNYRNYKINNISSKAVVFDLDETLGTFFQFSLIIDCIEKNFEKKLNQSEFNILLDNFIEYLRPNILNILFHLKNEKINNSSFRVLIFTNNQGPKDWANKIKNYFNNKLNYKLFDQIIGAYMIGNTQRESLRTSHDKSYNDLLACANISYQSKICFIDDLYHNQMQNKNVSYIHVFPYEKILSKSTIKKKLNFLFNSYKLDNIIDYTDLNPYHSSNKNHNHNHEGKKILIKILQFLKY